MLLDFQFVQSEYTSGSVIADTPLHKPIIRNRMSRNLGPVFEELVKEAEHAFDNVLDLPDSRGE